MTVKDLIKRLKHLNQDSKVVIQYAESKKKENAFIAVSGFDVAQGEVVVKILGAGWSEFNNGTVN